MPTRHIPDSDLEYHLICYDKDGRERRESDGKSLSDAIVGSLKDPAAGITDVFLLSHGWKGDVPAALKQYDQWIEAMASCTDDVSRARARWPAFKPLIIGFHWPSQPWGDESLEGSFVAENEARGGRDAFIADWADRIADSDDARAALRLLYDEAQKDIEPDRLPAHVVDAYRTLEREAGLSADGVEGSPDGDREALDPQLAYEDWQDISETSFGGGGFGGLLSPLRQLSFWTMKKRARQVGEFGGHDLVRRIVDTGVRLHLMGHSFGCIVVSSMLRGQDAQGLRASSAFLVQGAMSLWSFSGDLPGRSDRFGYFRPVIDTQSVAGPMVVTTSKFDRAVGTLYPLAAGAFRQVDYDAVNEDLPKYGAIGTFGLQGKGLALEPRDITRDLKHTYGFVPGRIYNLRSDDVICEGGGLSGAHSDISHSELGHVFWEAVLATPDT